MQFSFEEIDKDLYLVKKHYLTSKGGHGSDISGPYWMLIETEVINGHIWWNADGKKVIPGEKHFTFVPPYSWALEHYKAGTEIRISGLISKVAFKTPVFSDPVVFETELSLPTTINDVEKFLKRITEYSPIGVNSKPSALSLRAKQMIDQGFSGSIEIGDIAKKLKTSAAVLSRKFKSDYGQTPVFYRKGLKVTVGMYELMMGTSPIKAAEMAGYNDLGRFYKQFKAYLKQTPAEYLEKSKNAKKRKSSKGI